MSKILKDGTLCVTVDDFQKVKRVLVQDNYHFGGLYYPDNVPSADRPNATEIMNAYHEGVHKGIAEAYEAYGAERSQEKTISVDALREILSDVKEAHRNNSEAEAVISDVWDEVVDMLKGADNEKL